MNSFEYDRLFIEAYDKIDQLEGTGHSIQVTIDNEEYYYVGDFGSSIDFISKKLYDEKYRNDPKYASEKMDDYTMLDVNNDCLSIKNGDNRLSNIYQQIIDHPILDDVWIFF